MCSCAVVDQAFAAQLGCWAGAPSGNVHSNPVDVITKRSKGE